MKPKSKAHMGFRARQLKRIRPEHLAAILLAIDILEEHDGSMDEDELEYKLRKDMRDREKYPYRSSVLSLALHYGIEYRYFDRVWGNKPWERPRISMPYVSPTEQKK